MREDAGVSWFQSACPRCHGMMFVPATFLGHAVVCDKCGVTFVPNPIAPQPPTLMPYTAPPLPQLQPIPPQGAYGMPSAYPPPSAYLPPSALHRPPDSPPSDFSYPTIPTPPPNISHDGDERIGAAHPFGSPLPEIEILPPPSVMRLSSRKRPTGTRSHGVKRSRGSSTAEAATSSKRNEERERRRKSKRRSRRATAPPVSEEAARAAREEVELVERRLRRARQRRKISFALVAIGMIAMSFAAYLMITRFRPTRSASAETPPSPATSPTQTTSSMRFEESRS